MDDQLPLFEEITPEEFEVAHTAAKVPRARRSRVPVTEPRNNTTWYALPHAQAFSFCTCPAHEDIQAMLNPEQKSYRDKYPVRMVYEIKPGMLICRDCFVNEGDKDG